VLASSFRERLVTVSLGVDEPSARDLVLLTGRNVEGPAWLWGFSWIHQIETPPRWHILLDGAPPQRWLRDGLPGEPTPLPVGDYPWIRRTPRRGFRDLYATTEINGCRVADVLLATDDGAEAWINGHRLLADLAACRGFTRWDYRLDLTPHLRRGRNVLAVHVRNIGGLAFLDALVRERPTWWWRTTPPPDGWQAKRSVARGRWTIGAPTFKGTWQDLYVRRVLDVVPQDAESLALRLAVDDTVRVWVNGKPAFGPAGAADERLIPIGKHVQSGRNLLAFHVRNTGGDCTLDVRITAGEDPAEQWCRLEGRGIVLEAPPDYALLLKRRDAVALVDRAYGLCRGLFGALPYEGRPIAFRFDCTVDPCIAVAGNPARIGKAFWGDPPPYGVIIHEMLHDFMGMPEFAALIPNGEFVEVWPDTIRPLVYRHLGMERAFEADRDGYVAALTRELAAGRRGAQLSRAAWQGFLLRLIGQHRPTDVPSLKAVREILSLAREAHRPGVRLRTAARWNRLAAYFGRGLGVDVTKDFLAVGAPIDPARVRRLLRR
jgi:hypothetical protein